MNTIYTDDYTIDAIFLAINDLQDKRAEAETPIDYLRILGDLAGGIEGLLHQIIADTPEDERDWQAIADALNLPTAARARESYEPPSTEQSYPF